MPLATVDADGTLSVQTDAGVSVSFPPPGVTADAVTLDLVATFDYDTEASGETRRPEKIVVWVDGVLALQSGDYNAAPAFRGHGMTVVVAPHAWGHAVTLDRLRAGLGGAGPHEVRVTLYDRQKRRLFDVARQVTLSAGTPALPRIAAGVTRSLFGLAPKCFTQVPALQTVAQIKAAGVTCLEVGLPAGDDAKNYPSYAAWEAAAVPPFRADLQFCADNGFGVVLIGDGLTRSPTAMAWVLQTPWAPAAIVRIGQVCGEFAAIVVAAEMQDESAASPADSPHFAVVRDKLREGWAGLRMAWPNRQPYAWEARRWSDYASRYWDATDGAYGRSAEGRTLPQLAAGVGRAAAVLPPGWPWLCQVSASGPEYRKLAAGQHYTPGTDELQFAGVTPSDIVAQTWAALAYGAGGVRVYQYDYPPRGDRGATPVGAANLCEGTAPDKPTWPGVVAAFTSVAAHEAALAGCFLAPTVLPRAVVGRRAGPAPLTWSVNICDTPQPLPDEAAPAGIAGVLVTPAGTTPFAGGLVPAGGVVIFAG